MGTSETDGSAGSLAVKLVFMMCYCSELLAVKIYRDNESELQQRKIEITTGIVDRVENRDGQKPFCSSTFVLLATNRSKI